MRFCSGAAFWVSGRAALLLVCSFWFLGRAAFLLSCGFWSSAADTFRLTSKSFGGAAGGGQNVLTAAQQGAAPDRLQLRSLRSCLAAVSALPAAGELGRSAAARGVTEIVILNNMKPKLLLFLLLPCFSSAGCAQKWEPSPKRQPDLYLVPNFYVGWLHVEYGVKGAPSLPVRWGYRVYKFPRSGKIRTSSPLLFGWAKDKIYYTAPKGWKELSVSEDQGKGMIWGGSSSGSNEGGITTFDSKGKKTVIWTPATSDVFIGTWKQFYHRKTEAPRSKEEEAALKED